MSPHISSIRERIQINREKIDKDFFVEFLKIYESAINEEELRISFFDFMTVMAFKYWEHKEVEIAVMEVGLGGRLDSTNILESQNVALSVITGIGLDHMSYLGDTVEEITGKFKCFLTFNFYFLAEKCGIIKDNVPVLIGNTVVEEVVNKFALEKKSRVYRCDENFGDFVLENRRLIEKGAEILMPNYNYYHSVEWAFRQKMSCRFEMVSQTQLRYKKSKVKTVILDVGHNPQSLEKVFEKFYKEIGRNKKVCVLFGCKFTKDYRTANKLISNFAKKIYFVVPPEKIK